MIIIKVQNHSNKQRNLKLLLGVFSEGDLKSIRKGGRVLAFKDKSKSVISRMIKIGPSVFQKTSESSKRPIAYLLIKHNDVK